MQNRFRVHQGVPAQMLENYLNECIPEDQKLSCVMVIPHEDDLSKYEQASNVISIDGEVPPTEPNIQVIPFAYPITEKK